MDDISELDLDYDSLVHDLGNVFEIITDAAQQLSKDRRWKQLSATLVRSVDRGRRILGAIPDRTPQLSAIVDDAIQSVTDFCTAARKPRMRFNRQINPDVRLPGAGKDWERVFANLFLNAAQISTRPGRIDIGTNVADGSLTITVSDNGPGIREDLLPGIFRPHVSTKVKRSGRSGLGLHIVASIVKKYSGKVTAANREQGNGAVFCITLPVSDRTVTGL